MQFSSLDYINNFFYQEWSNSETTTAMWSLIDHGDTSELIKALNADPDLVYLRSEDGRGPLFWAYEYERYDMVKILLDRGQFPARLHNI